MFSFTTLSNVELKSLTLLGQELMGVQQKLQDHEKCERREWSIKTIRDLSPRQRYFYTFSQEGISSWKGGFGEIVFIHPEHLFPYLSIILFLLQHLWHVEVILPCQWANKQNLGAFVVVHLQEGACTQTSSLCWGMSMLYSY